MFSYLGSLGFSALLLASLVLAHRQLSRPPLQRRLGVVLAVALLWAAIGAAALVACGLLVAGFWRHGTGGVFGWVLVGLYLFAGFATLALAASLMRRSRR